MDTVESNASVLSWVWRLRPDVCMKNGTLATPRPFDGADRDEFSRAKGTLGGGDLRSMTKKSAYVTIS
jgi:hypothetical protein